MRVNASRLEVTTMMKRIENRLNHPRIPHNSRSYNTLSYPHHDYNLNPQQCEVFNKAFDDRNTLNHNYVGWDKSDHSIPSNEGFI